MAADLPENYDKHPAFEFIKRVPADWDESRVITAKIGDHVTIARRNGQDWYLGSVTDENFRELEIPLDFLPTGKAYTATIYCDAMDTDWEKNPTSFEMGYYEANSTETLKAVLSNAGGMAIHFTPKTENESAWKPSPLRMFHIQNPQKLHRYKDIYVFGSEKKEDHLAVKSNLQLTHQPSQEYSKGKGEMLVDGIQGKVTYYEKHWLGFHGTDLEVVLDLGEPKTVREVTANFLRNHESWIFLPKTFDVSTSVDGVNFTNSGTETYDQQKALAGTAIWQPAIRIEGNEQVRFIRVIADNPERCPAWHSAAGDTAWIFLDEIMVNEFPKVATAGVKGNYFSKKKYVPEQLPTFEDVRHLLPQPILTDNPNWNKLYWAAWKMAFQNLKQPAPLSSLVSNFADEGFSENIFQWDTHFMMHFWKYAHHVFDAIQSHDNFYCRQHDDGYMCREIVESNGEDFVFQGIENTVNPPLFAWAEFEYYQFSKDYDRLKSIFPALEKHSEWLEANRGVKGHDGLFWNTGLGSGMDNSPREGTAWVDMSAQMGMHYYYFSLICQEIWEVEESAGYYARYIEIRDAINQKLWDEQAGFYFDLKKEGSLSETYTLGGAWPLASHVAGESQAKKSIEKLRSREHFNSTIPFATLATSSREYSGKGDYWRGGVWAPTNYMAMKGLVDHEAFEMAHEAAAMYLSSMSSVFHNTGTIWENYSPDSMEAGTPAIPDFVGWSGLGPITMLIENIIGIRVGTKDRIYWSLLRTDEHGIENLNVAGNSLTLVCDERTSKDEAAKITVETEKFVTLVLSRSGKKHSFDIQPGRHVLHF